MNKIFIYARPCVNKMTWAFYLPGFRVSVLWSCSAVFLLFEIWKKPAKNCPIFSIDIDLLVPYPTNNKNKAGHHPLNASEKDIRASSYFFTRRAADVVSEACLTVMTGDRHNERAAVDFSMIIFDQTPSWLVWILTDMPVWLYFSSFLLSFVLFLNTELYILYECGLCLIFITIRKLAI